ncbi:MAG: hypothetical protein ACI9SY_000776 [Candidatus Paceibacteria bacterium]|jgi:hypothetical protein
MSGVPEEEPDPDCLTTKKLADWILSIHLMDELQLFACRAEHAVLDREINPWLYDRIKTRLHPLINNERVGKKMFPEAPTVSS